MPTRETSTMQPSVSDYHEKEDRGHGLTTAKPCRELEEAWALLDEGMSSDVFIEQLIKQLSSLQEHFVRMAWSQWDLTCFCKASGWHVNKRKLQGYVYVAFFTLMIAAAGDNGFYRDYYRAEEDVKSSIIVRRRSRQNKYREEDHVAKIRPDGAVTLARRLDPFAMVLIHIVHPYDEYTYVRDRDVPFVIDEDKSPCMTEWTAEVIRPCLDPSQYDEVALPFIIITGNLCSLYVTTLDRHGTPRIQIVAYPDGGNARNNDLSQEGSAARKKFFLVFAVLLNKFRTFFEANCRQEYERRLEERGMETVLENLPTFYLSGDDYQETNKIDGTAETAAQEAAACNGHFMDVNYPFERCYLLTKYGAGCTNQCKSPYYFTGYTTSSIRPTKVFLKVWKKEDRRFSSVESERRHHKQAFEAGIPVAAPIFDEIVWSESSSGADHFVFVTEYLEEDLVETVLDVLQYSVSLMETVLQLHQKAGMLHCTLKPENVRWNKGVVKLIDFENAQEIDDARWKSGPNWYLAPEVLKKLPCSTKTDAYSVGQTIRAQLQRLNNKEKSKDSDVSRCLEDIATKLTETDPDQRWSLEQALDEIEKSTMHLVPASLWKKKSSADTTLLEASEEESTSRPSAAEANTRCIM